MSSGILILVIVVVLVVLAGAAMLLWPAVRSRRLRSTFGPEYERIVAEAPDRRAAEREMAERERRHAELELRELPADRREYFTRTWSTVQERFVDQPADSVTAADRLLTALMAERGYPTGSYDQQLADLSVEHAATLGHYRDAHAVAVAQSEGRASTEDLRAALVHYRTLFLDLMKGGGKSAESTTEVAAQHNSSEQQTDPAKKDATI
ncbi:hypothetical protein [Nocardia arizonensis]|uniref:hypothetical protein n=1 Tax=Nocardia arizonensis TaxID=1141647 RepID=UPI0006D0F289|nr:hypothetical protein [Nocardia arizonensis]